MKTTLPVLICVALACMFSPLPAYSQEAGAAKLEFHDFLRATLSPSTIAQPAFAASWSQLVSRPAGFGSGPEAYGYRYGVSLADNVDGKFVRKFAFPVLFGQRDLYRPSGSGSVLARTGHAVLHSFFVSTPSGEERINMSGVPASIALAALSDTYEPRPQRTLRATMTRVGTNSLGYFATDFINEFDLVCKARKLLHFRCR